MRVVGETWRWDSLDEFVKVQETRADLRVSAVRCRSHHLLPASGIGRLRPLASELLSSAIQEELAESLLGDRFTVGGLGQPAVAGHC